jgi:hypothetical protein
MRVLVKQRSMSTSIGSVKNGEIIDLPEAEIRKIIAFKPLSLEVLPELPLEAPKAAPKKAPAKKKAKFSVKSINKDK